MGNVVFSFFHLYLKLVPGLLGVLVRPGRAVGGGSNLVLKGPDLFSIINQTFLKSYFIGKSF